MPRSRSRSPRRERDRSERDRPDRERQERDRPDRERRRSRSRERRHRHRRSRSPRSRRSRSHSPRRRSRSGSPGRRSRSRDRDALDKNVSMSSSHVVGKPKLDKDQLESMSQDEQNMMKLMGFSTFETTKNKKVEGNDIYVTNLMRKRRYRQYMNRRGGFNRPLDFIA